MARLCSLLLLTTISSALALGCGGTTPPADNPETEEGEGTTMDEGEGEPHVSANAPPPAPIGSDEIPDVPPAD